MGFLNYYHFVDNRYVLRKIHYILKVSLQRTICRKLQIRIRECLKKFGPNVTLNINKKDGSIVQLSFECPTLRRNPMGFLGKGPHSDPLAVKKWKISTLSALGQPCANCGSTDRIEMHHLKHLKTMNSKLDSFGRMMARINRKQVPLCRPCHEKVHNGTHTGFTLRHFKTIR